MANKVLVLQDGKAITTEGSANGQVLTWSEDDSQATFETPTVSPVTMGGDVTGSSDDATVVAIQNIPVSTIDPTVGKVLQFNGMEYTPADIPQGGSGGGGVTYFFNKGTPVTGGNLPSGTYQLGRTAESGQTDVALTDLAVGSWTRVGGFVTDASDPSLTSIPAGLWDFNIWAESTAAANNQAFIRVRLYAYDGSTNPEAGTLLAETDYIYLYDANVPAQYIASMLIAGGTTLASTSTRLYLLIEAQASTSNRDLTIYFGNSTPSHTHTTVPSVAGTGLVHVVNGVVQSPASLLVDADVAASGTANIARNKLATGTAHAIGVNDASGYLTSAAALTNGQLLIGSTGAAPVAASLTGGTGVSVTNGAGSVSVAIGQSVATSDSPTFAGATLTGLTASQYVKTNGSKALSSAATIPASDVTSIPYDLSGDAYGTLSSGQTIFRFLAPRNITLTAITAAGGASVKVQVNDSDVTLPGTISVTTGQKVSVLTTSTGTDAYFTITAVVA